MTFLPHRPRAKRIIMLLIALSLPPAVARTVWNPTTDFSITNGNPNGVWTYGWMNTSFTTFTAFTNTTTDGFGFNLWNGGIPAHVGLNASGTTSFNAPPGSLTLHPGSGNEPAVLRWTAPVTATVTIAGSFGVGDSGAMSYCRSG